jgi:hypothetical protein
MLRFPLLTTVRAVFSVAQALARASRSVISPRIIKGWNRLKPSLTCRQDDLPEDLLEEGMQTKA